MVARFLERLNYVLKNLTNIGSIVNKFGGTYVAFLWLSSSRLK